MRFNRFATLGKIIVLIAIVFGARINGLAQSTTDLIAHYVEVSPAEDGISYNVNAYLSVLDSGNLSKDLTQEAFAIQEDGQKVEIQNLRVVAEEPANIVLVMDTSIRMSETDMSNAKSAAMAFVAGLKPSDQVALITFDASARNQVDEFTTDHKKITDIINTLASTRETGACIYDAAYSAVKMFSTLPTGNRAVILLTQNSKDETANGAICSDHTADEVVNNASEGELRTPIHVIGLELDPKDDKEKKNVENIESFATKTGGFYLNLSSSSKLANTFQLLSDRFRAQYILTYTSISAPGPHSLIVSVNTPGQPPPPLDSDTRKFTLPALPPHITFISPLEGATIGNSLKIAVSLTTQGQAIVERVAFEVNGTKEGEDDTKPYELELDAKKYPVGLMTVSVTAYGANNTELARSSINLIRAEATEVSASAPTAESAPISATPAPTSSNTSLVFMAIALGGLSIVAIGALIFFLLRQQKQAKALDVENYVDDDDTMPAMRGIPVYRKVEENRKADNPETGSDALGSLTIEASDDSSLIGHRFEITASLVTLGRSADNDINFPNDKPVSRHHAEIYQISGKLYLREVEMADSSGTAKPPKYGTFLNQTPMGSDPALLKTGDEILLGKRVRLKFESHTRDIDADSLTYDDDDLTASVDLDKTQDQ